MMNFISRNYLRLLPLLVAGVIWLVGYIYIHKIMAFGICPPDGYECSKLMDTIGFPARQLAYWLVPTSLIVLFTPLIFLKRWVVFSSIYLIVTWVAIANGDGGGMFNGGREPVAGFFGILLLVATILWLTVHVFISWRKAKKVAPTTP